MNVSRETSTHGRYAERKPTAMTGIARSNSSSRPVTMRSAGSALRYTLYPSTNRMPARPVHQTAGLPKERIDEAMPAPLKSA